MYMDNRKILRAASALLCTSVLVSASALALDKQAYADAQNDAQISVSDAAQYSVGLQKSDIQRKRSVPVLMYHLISDDIWGSREMFTSPSVFRQQLQYLKDHGYQTITFEDLDHLERYPKPVLLTFDDGYADNYTTVYPMLKEFGMKATFFVVPNNLDRQHNMTREQIKELSASGVVSIQSHSLTHANMTKLNASQQEYEMKESQRQLRELTGKSPIALTYPEGGYTKTTLSLTARYYHFGICAGGNRWKISDDFYTIPRYRMHRSTTMAQFEDYVDQSVSRIFTDVSASKWSTPYIEQVYSANYMRGTSGDTFQPTKTLTRAESVQILYALAGKPAVSGQTPFHDVASGAWYQQAVTWAYQKRITSGVLPNEFRPNDPISREQLVVMLYRYSGSPAVSDLLHKKHYADAKEVSGWAQPAMNWAIANGVISGIPSGHKVLLSPHTNSTREQAATIIAKTFC